MTDTVLTINKEYMNKEPEKLEIDPEFENLIPALSDEERDSLERNIIERKGCLNPIIVWDGTIVDGHNRYLICSLLNQNLKEKLQYNVKRIEFSSRDEAKIWIIQTQLGRRNLTKYQRGQLALAKKEIVSTQAKENQEFGGKEGCLKSDKPIDTGKELAKSAGISRDTLFKIEKIKERASEEDKEKLKSGSTTINAVHNKLKEKDGKEAAIIRRTKIIHDNVVKMFEEKKDDIPSSCTDQLQLSIKILEKIVIRVSDLAA